MITQYLYASRYEKRNLCRQGVVNPPSLANKRRYNHERRALALIDIVLATFNGAQYLDLQIESLLAQTHADLRILARDDGSTDDTPAILRRFEQASGGRLHILRDSFGNLGPAGNFATLLKASDAAYIMFCDQDDVWDADKVAVTLAAMLQAENDSPGAPVLVHTDARIVDSRLQLLSPSYYAYVHIRARTSLPRLFFENTVIGCTSMINRPLADVAMPIPSGALMHDWWLALVAEGFGTLRFVDQATINYRQHPANQIGAFSYGWKTVFELTGARIAKAKTNCEDAFRQALIFEHTYRGRMPTDSQSNLALLRELRSRNWFARRLLAARNGMHKTGVLRTGLFYLLI
jgi:glycosyltransferase involved in cell wall biosynthesis